MKGLLFFLCFLVPALAFGAYEWEPGTALPAAPGGYELGDNLDSLIQYVYAWLLGAGGLFAFIRLIWAGIQWGGAGGNISKVQDAQATIKNVIQGLAILLFSWLLLNTVNPNIVNPDIRLPETGLVVSSDNQASPILARVSLTGSLFSKIFSNQKIIPIKGNEIQPFKWSNYAFRIVPRKTKGEATICEVAKKYKIPCCVLKGIIETETGNNQAFIGTGTCQRNNQTFKCCIGNYCGPPRIACNQYTAWNGNDNLDMCNLDQSAELLARALLFKLCQADGKCNSGWAKEGDYILENYSVPEGDYTAAAYFYGLSSGCRVTACSQFRWGEGKSYCDSIEQYCEKGEILPSKPTKKYCEECNKLEMIPAGVPIDCSRY